MNFVGQQRQLLDAIADWLADRNGPQFFYAAGYAGTGKTTIALEATKRVKGRVCFAALTGIAALVMAGKGCYGARTIHSLIYRRSDRKSGGSYWKLNQNSDLAGAALLVVDEVSMVPEEMAVDILSFGTKVLVLGDPFQLPPVEGEGYFTSGDPHFFLTEVHRQALESPIIKYSMMIREGWRCRDVFTDGGVSAIRRRDLGVKAVLGADMVITGKNATRQSVNARIRQLKGFSGPLPNAGETLMCLKNNSKSGMINGQTWTVENAFFARGSSSEHKFADAEDVLIDLRISDGDYQATAKARIEDFIGEKVNLTNRELRAGNYDRFDYGYARTCHKAQGSQANRVLIFDESYVFREESLRWLYTALTRAEHEAIIVI